MVAGHDASAMADLSNSQYKESLATGTFVPDFAMFAEV